ncbi:MAG TPA: cytochrome-c oxidase, cbb3-type subunit III [Rhizomicrobium sp.]|nr:cytochrome-c oxidase, cbb3-type subunit III [Rhizomicrobium sp.]
MSTHDKDIDTHTGTETTGHEWDGITELNTPLPRWWLGIFYACIVWAIGYWILMPAWPTLDGYTQGLLNHSQREDVANAVSDLAKGRAAREKALAHATLKQIQDNPDLLQFAMAEGHSAFANNCAQCHGAGAQGFKGYPNLNDDVWLWGGTLADIQHTITVGVRSTATDTRQSQMPAFGKDAILTETQIADLTQFVMHLSHRAADPTAVKRATKLFADNCAACHGDKGTGNRTMGAPNLTDRDWLYGGAPENIHDQIWYGRGGVMPTWGGKLSPETIKSLAVYVHSLGGGE